MHNDDMNPDVRKVLEAAVMAPSGENAQPWQFRIREAANQSTIDVCVSEEREQSLYGWGNRAAYVAIGAALENMRLASPLYGYTAAIRLLPDAHERLLAARVTLERRAAPVDPLAERIHTRATNRRPYDAQALSAYDAAALRAAGNAPQCRLALFTDRADINALARVGAVNELVMLNNPILHSFFFNHVNWTRAEDDEKKAGFFIETLELPPPARVGFRIMRDWKRARFLNRFFGFNLLVAKQNAALYSTASAIGVVVSERESARDALDAGMFIERIWLTADALGLSVQPLTGVLYWTLRDRAGVRDGFSDEERKTFLQAYAEVERRADVGDGAAYFMFRVGHAQAPTARARRFAVDDVSEII